MTHCNLPKSFILLLGFVLFANSQKIVDNFRGNVDGVVGMSRSEHCGNDILTESSGEIGYKVDSPVQPNERCVWLVRPQKAIAFSVAVFSLGFEPSSDHKLTVTTFTAEGDSENVVVNNTGIFNVRGHVLMVTLHTGNSSLAPNVTGFSLLYDVPSLGDMSYESTYVDMFFNAKDSQRTYLGAGSGLNTRSLSFELYDNFWSGNSSQNSVKYVYGVGDVVTWSPSNFVEVYVYDVEVSWTLLNSFNYENEFEVFESKDLVLFVGRSESNVENLFHYYVANYFCHDQ